MTLKIEDIVVHLRWGVCTIKNIAKSVRYYGSGINPYENENTDRFICQLDVHRPYGINLDAVWVPASELYKIVED